METGQPRGRLLSWLKAEELLKPRKLLGGGRVSKSSQPGAQSKVQERQQAVQWGGDLCGEDVRGELCAPGSLSPEDPWGICPLVKK